jgi:hypothetical protein
MALVNGIILDQTTNLPIQGVEILEIISPITISPQEIVNKLKTKKIISSLIESKLEKTWVVVVPTFDSAGFVGNITVTSPTQKGEDVTNISGKVTVRTESLRSNKQNYFFEKDISANIDIIIEFVSQKYKTLNLIPTSISNG